MRSIVAGLLVGASLSITLAAAAEEKQPAAAAEADDRFGHRGQGGLRVGLVGGYRMVLRYDDSPFCAEPDLSKANPNDQQKFCGHTAPLALDVALSYGLVDSLEPYLWGRFGLQAEDETDTEPVIIVGVGSRIYTMADSAFKIFIEPAAGLELEGGRDTAVYQLNDPEYKTDLVLHLAAGPQLDLSKNFGVFLDAGMTTGILRSIHTNLELQLGVQGRLP